MHKFNKTLLRVAVAAALVTPMAVMAQAKAPESPHTFTGNVGLFNQYIFRGLTQTDGKPALQGGFDYVHASGFYAGVWGSNISWMTDASYAGGSYAIELGTYLGFKMPVGDFTFDVGFLRYNYPGRAPLTGIPAGFKKADVAVISYHGREHSFLLRHDRLGDFTFRSFTGSYDLFQRPVYGEGDMLMESVLRFKGQSAPAIVFAEIDFDELDEKAIRRLFVGATRATMKLVLVLSESAATRLLERIGSN